MKKALAPIATTPAARPSRPSIRLIAFTATKIPIRVTTIELPSSREMIRSGRGIQ